MLFKESGDSVNEGRSEAEKYSCCLWDPAGLLMEHPAIANCNAKESSRIQFTLLFYLAVSFMQSNLDECKLLTAFMTCFCVQTHVRAIVVNISYIKVIHEF